MPLAARPVLVFYKPYDHAGKDQLEDKAHGNADGELGVLGRVTEGVHTGQGADAAADGGRSNKRGFRDAPLLFLSFLLVNEHKQEGGRID